MDEHAPIVYDLTKFKEETKDWDKDPSAYLLRYYSKYYYLAGDGKVPSTRIIDQETGLEILFGDQFVYQSPNKLCIIGLAPSHPLIAQRNRYKVLNLRFDTKILAALPQPTSIPANSKKQPPASCNSSTVICKIEALDLWAKKKIEEGEDNTVSESDFSVIDADPTPSEQTTQIMEDQEKSGENSKGPKTENKDKMPGEFESKDPSRVIFVVRGAISGHVIELNEKLVRRGTSVITDPIVLQTVIEKASTHGFIAVVRPKIDKTEIALENLCTMEKYNAKQQ
ncbi:hypothetical protein BGZ76_003681 [Entomortierella beljakovae]|nr:hypothetical protein BGZ76_003681 [Entomortierella beljakovae]